jgi:hypothetical protein
LFQPGIQLSHLLSGHLGVHQATTLPLQIFSNISDSIILSFLLSILKIVL